MNEWTNSHFVHQRREDLIQEIEAQRLMKVLRIRRR